MFILEHTIPRPSTDSIGDNVIQNLGSTEEENSQEHTQEHVVQDNLVDLENSQDTVTEEYFVYMDHF